MIDPVNLNPVVAPGGSCSTAKTAVADAAASKDFKSHLLDSLNEVSNLQQQADDGVTKLATGQTDNVTEVLSAVKKADVAFSLLMEMRNKLMDAYTEIKDMRV